MHVTHLHEAHETIKQGQMLYEIDADGAIGTVFTDSLILVVSSSQQRIYSQRFGCAFSHLGSEQGERPFNRSLLTLNHLFRWTQSSMAEREKGTERQRKRGIKREERVKING